MFVAVPPMLEVIELYPRIFDWFINLSWVLFITRRSQREEDRENQIEPEPQTEFSYSLPADSRESGFSNANLPSIMPLAAAWPSNGKKRSFL